ncbi:hypothetical protein G5I_13484 [Acromyrmex echinatior]|uniref:Uncharacterized protein n=1 Tax=Acromyrmex echinatior TaxID=103372 RepID=F4X559_ACREC|nr:hypothetical protein G5I_13484 [Acromyrmex echinatior]
MDKVNTRCFSEITPQLQFKSQKSKEESNAENQIDRYISRNGSIVLSEHQRLSDLPVYVKFQRVSANWISGQLPPTLCNINLTIKPGSIILTQGSKYNFPGNLSGYFTNNPNLRMSYASQEPWLFDDTGFVKMQGNYNELVQSNKDFIDMLDNLNQAQRKEEENMRRASEMSKRITITKRISRLSITNHIYYERYIQVIRYYFAIVQHSDIDDSDYVENIPEAEMTSHGRIASRVYKE